MKLILALSASIITTASAQTTQQIMHTDRAGVSILERQDHTPSIAIRDFAQPRGGILWTFPDTASIPQSVALGDNGRESWVGHWFNDKRMSKFDTTGAGLPDFVYSLAFEDPTGIGVDAAANSSLAAVLTVSVTGGVQVRAFTSAGGNTPLWTYPFSASYTGAAQRAVAVSADGSRVAACAFDGSKTLLVLLDASGSLLNSLVVNGFSQGVEMSADGTRILLTNGAVARLYDAATMTEIYNLSASGSGGYHRISADGTAIAAGGFNIKAAREIAGNWQIVYSANGSQDWFGGGVALSGDGQTLFVLSHNYGAGYLPNGHRVVDLLTGTIVAQSSYTGTGTFQNSAVIAQANDDGTRFACASWGDQGNTQPEVRIYDRDLVLIGSIDTPGSPFDLDMSPDGNFVLVGTKSVHANTFGSGGTTYAYGDPNTCVADLNNDGILDFFDVQMLLNLFAAQDPVTDFNNDGLFDFFDIQIYLNLFATGCP